MFPVMERKVNKNNNSSSCRSTRKVSKWLEKHSKVNFLIAKPEKSTLTTERKTSTNVICVSSAHDLKIGLQNGFQCTI